VLYKPFLKGLWSRVVVNASPLLEQVKILHNFEKRTIEKMNGSIKENGMWGSRLDHEVHKI